MSSRPAPWKDHDVLLVGHSQMEGFGPRLAAHFERTGARVHLHAVRGLNVRGFRRAVYGGDRPISAELSDRIPFVVVALSGNGAVTEERELAGNLDFLRAEYPRAVIFWLSHTKTRTGSADDAEREDAYRLEQSIVPHRDGFVLIDMWEASKAPLAADGIHHTDAGYQQLADLAWRQLVTVARNRWRQPTLRPWPILLGAAGLGLAVGFGANAIRRRLGEDEEG